MPKSNQPHPLEASVLAIFEKRPVQDRVTLAAGMSDPDPYTTTFIKTGPDAPKLGIAPNKAYLMVAEDVLGWMYAQGKLSKDTLGWYRLAP